MRVSRPRRAKNRPGRVLIPLVLLLAVAIGLFGWRTDFSFDPASLVAGRAPTGTGSTPPPSPAGGGGRVTEQTQQATHALESCRKRVSAGDAVIKAARTGVGHWSDHVEAQTKADRDKITITMLDKVFDKTREAGPADQKRYAKARTTYRSADGSCKAVPGAPKDQAADLSTCGKRADAQKPVLRAAEPAMEDWKSHLDQMAHSRKHPSPGDQEAWRKAWRAAPPNIHAFEKAIKKFRDGDTASCAD